MIKSVLSYIISASFLAMQFGLSGCAEGIIEDTAIQVFEGKNLSKYEYKNEIIEDEINEKAFNGTPLEKTEPCDIIIDDGEVQDAFYAKQDPEKIEPQQKLIQDYAESQDVVVSSVNYLVAKKGLYEGQKVKFAVVYDVYKDGELFIKNETPVTAYIETITKSSFLGDPSQIIVGRFVTKDINGKEVELSGEVLKNGANRAYWVRPLVITGYLLPVVGSPLLLFFFVKGGRAKIKPKYKFTLYYE